MRDNDPPSPIHSKKPQLLSAAETHLQVTQLHKVCNQKAVGSEWVNKIINIGVSVTCSACGLTGHSARGCDGNRLGTVAKARGALRHAAPVTAMVRARAAADLATGNKAVGRAWCQVTLYLRRW